MNDYSQMLKFLQSDWEAQARFRTVFTITPIAQPIPDQLVPPIGSITEEDPTLPKRDPSDHRLPSRK